MMEPKKVIERLEVMRDCYEMFFGSNDSAGFEAKYKENKEAFEYAVQLTIFFTDILQRILF